MKKLAAILCLSALTSGAFAQGIINFANNNSTLVSATIGGNTASISGAGNYYFGLLTSASGTAGTFTFSGNYATNSVAAGRFVLNGQVVNGWAPGTTKFYEVAGWEKALGAAWNPAWLASAPAGLFGLSAVGSGVIGGTDATGNSFPTLNLFGGTGITTGFTLTGGAVVPEPTSMALAGLGAAALLIFRRRK